MCTHGADRVRELRQNASEWIRRAHAGERIEVTRRGEVMAVLGPPPVGGTLAHLRATGRLKPASVTPPLPQPVPARHSASDAIHLAAALAAGDDLGGVVTYDDRMADAARDLGLATLAPGR